MHIHDEQRLEVKMLYVLLRLSLSTYVPPDTLYLQEFPIVCEPCLGPNPVRCASQLHVCT